MDTINLKKFAVRSRQVLKNGVAKQLHALGFDADGRFDPYYLPLPMEGGYKWRNNIYDHRYYRKWVQLVHAIEKKGLDYVYEQAAYAWFNRFVAIRLLEANELVTSEVLTPVDDIRTPQILLDAQQGDRPPVGRHRDRDRRSPAVGEQRPAQAVRYPDQRLVPRESHPERMLRFGGRLHRTIGTL